MRYLPLTESDRQDMLSAIGAGKIEDLFRDVPEEARLINKIELPDHKSELEVEEIISNLSEKNIDTSGVPSFLGAGAYRHHIPAAVDHLIQRGEFLTSYTPYQPEISQGTLQALFEFQTQVSMITGMEGANASMYDGATACAEAVLMATRITRRDKVILSGGLHPHYKDVTETQTRYLNLNIINRKTDIDGSENLDLLIDDQTACVVVQNPNFLGHLKDLTHLSDLCNNLDVLLIVVVTEVVSLGGIISPGEMGADIVVGEGQSLGNPLTFGGPYVGLFATHEKYVRQMPGRLCGQTVDNQGSRGWVLTLSTREQHIRREKATSNICTNSGLCALSFTIHLALLGEIGFRKLAELNHSKALQLAEKLSELKGLRIINKTYFNEFSVKLPRPASDLVTSLAKKSILAGVPLSRLISDDPELNNVLLVSATECTTEQDMDALVEALDEEF